VIWATFPKPIATRLAMIAPDHGVSIAAGSRFGIGGAFARNIRIPYVLPRDRLTEAIARLGEAQAALDRGYAGAHSPAPTV
jgi:hypothetical protein